MPCHNTALVASPQDRVSQTCRRTASRRHLLSTRWRGLLPASNDAVPHVAFCSCDKECVSPVHPHRAFGSTYALPMTMCIQGEVNYVQHTAVVLFAMRHMYEYLYAVSLKSSSICILTAPTSVFPVSLRYHPYLHDIAVECGTNMTFSVCIRHVLLTRVHRLDYPDKCLPQSSKIQSHLSPVCDSDDSLTL